MDNLSTMFFILFQPIATYYCYITYKKKRDLFLKETNPLVTFSCSKCGSKQTLNADQCLKLKWNTYREGSSHFDIFTNNHNVKFSLLCPVCNKKTLQKPINTPFDKTQTKKYRSIARHYIFIYILLMIVSITIISIL